MPSAIEALFGQPDSGISSPTMNDPYLSGVNPLVAPEHKGLFGMKGGFRDFLGTLGDALSGGQLYGNTRQREREADAMINFGADPLSAVQQLANVNPDKAMEFQNILAKQGENKAQNALMAEYRQAQIENERLKRQDLIRTRLSSYAKALEKDPRKAESWKVMAPGMRKMAADAGMEGIFDIPDEYSDEAVGRLSYAGLTPTQQYADEDRTRSVDSSIRDKEVRQGIARERLGISASSAATAHSDRQASLAERQRANKERERISREKGDGKGKGKGVKLVMPPGAPPLAPGQHYQKRN